MSSISISVPLPGEIALSAVQDRQSASYSGSRYLFREAAGAFKVQLKEDEYDGWRALLGGAYLVDHLVDNERADIMPAIADMLWGRFREDLHLDTQHRFRNYMLSQPQDEYEGLLNKLSQVNGLVEAQRQAITPQEVVAVRLQEADLLADMLSLPAEGHPDVFERIRFNNWLLGWSRAGYLVDSLRDIQDDYQNRDSGLEPSARARTSLARSAFKEILVAAQKTPPQLIGRCALVAFRYVSMNKKADMTSMEK
jgi:hypothetical protein